MKKSLLFIILFMIAFAAQAQKDTASIAGVLPQRTLFGDASPVTVSIYPVPVRENSFTIKTDKDIAFVRITNIIGQDIYREKYSTPLQMTKIFLENPKRGMYLVAILFGDGTKVVKKIMIEESE